MATPHENELDIERTADAGQVCWICHQNPADTGEHKIKRSDLEAVFGSGTNLTLYYHDIKRKNKITQSLKADIFKSTSRICAHCNTTRTQPHDRSWEKMSNWIRNRTPAIRAGESIRANKIFKHHTAREMLNVHIYFLKLFGCLIKEGGGQIPVEISPFSKAIVDGKAHEEVYLQIGTGDGTVGYSNIKCIRLDTGHILAFWLYRIKYLTANVIYAQKGSAWELDQTWHPRRGTNKLVIADLSGEFRPAIKTQ